MSMLRSFGSYFYNRRHTFMKMAGFLGSAYLVAQYVKDRIEDAKYKVLSERIAKETLQRRYNQTREDTTYTVTALIPALAEQILTEMDVEALTNELQSRSRGRKEARTGHDPQQNQGYLHPPSPSYFNNSPPTQSISAPPSESESSLASYDVTSRSDISASINPQSYDLGNAGSQRSVSVSDSQSWIDMPAVESLYSESTRLPTAEQNITRDGASISHNPNPAPNLRSIEPLFNMVENNTQVMHGDDVESSNYLSDSITTNSSALSYVDRPVSTFDTLSVKSSTHTLDAHSQRSPPISTSAGLSSDDTRSKAELWKEVKILTLTRTITTLYSTTLLSLLTVVQLFLLARERHVYGVWEAAMREEQSWSYANRSYNSNMDLDEDLDARMMEGLGLRVNRKRRPLGSADAGIMETEEKIPMLLDMSEDATESFLSLSYHILHVGWKDVGERVQAAVKGVFDEVSLKTKLDSVDFHRLMSSVRKKIDFEVVVDDSGTEHEKRFGFSAAMFPQPEHESIDMGDPITAGLSPGTALLAAQKERENKALRALRAETRDLLSSPDFEVVLEACLDRATEVLFDGLRRNVFVESRADKAEGEKDKGREQEDEREREVKIRLAGLLPGLARWSQLALNGLPNELVENMMDLREVNLWAGIILTKFDAWYR